MLCLSLRKLLVNLHRPIYTSFDKPSISQARLEVILIGEKQKGQVVNGCPAKLNIL
jgi:hypothetical protein